MFVYNVIFVSPFFIFYFIFCERKQESMLNVKRHYKLRGLGSYSSKPFSINPIQTFEKQNQHIIKKHRFYPAEPFPLQI